MASLGEEKSDFRKNSKQEEKVNGVFNWVFLLLLSLFANLIIENYLRYGIIKTPLEIIEIFFDFMNATKWWIFIYCIGRNVQAIFGFLIEKSLAMNVVSELIGTLLHAFNCLLALNIIFIIFTYYIFSPASCFLVSGMNIFLFFKYFSYVLVNRRHRLDLQKSLKDGEHNHSSKDRKVKYPENVTLKNVYVYLFVTPVQVYKIDPPTISEWKWKGAIHLLLKLSAACFVIAFLCYQYVHPYCKEILAFSGANRNLEALAVALKLLVPSAICNYLCLYTIVLNGVVPFPHPIVETDPPIYHSDWWNAEDIAIFWKKWNSQCQLILKEHVLVPMLKAGYNKFIAALAVGVVSGVVHEYAMTVSVRTFYGFATIQMVVSATLIPAFIPYTKILGRNVNNTLIFVYISLGLILLPLSAVSVIERN